MSHSCCRLISAFAVGTQGLDWVTVSRSLVGSQFVDRPKQLR
ncbi:hypothetical protein RISK_005592 [Rhodopirellula islandica]|uniref:Uncharacterized protein n=1 Tax=Rhodopirellula islandica TaxID=595434 RepID=A0A0J1B7U9_RHOIS|nr:hypothetical protein RISK_005592 [Rhodopirellula islandica]